MHRTGNHSVFHEFRTLYYGSIFLLSIMAFGTSGYMLIEGYSFTDALYMTLITISTVGFREVRELSNDGKIFTIILITGSFGVFGFILTSAFRIFFDGEYKKIIKYYKVKRKINNLTGHIIICGFGRNGRKAASDLLAEGKKVVILDQDAKVFEDEIDNSILNHKNFVWYVGDASHEEVLMKANPETALALIATLPNDAENLLIVLTIRQMNEKITIIARASDDRSYSKLVRAGATNVIMPDIVGGARMARLVTEPDVMEFLEMIMLREGVDVKIEEISCDELSFRSKELTIANLDIRRKTGISMIGLKKSNGQYIFNPDPALPLEPDDKLFVLGKPEQIASFKALLDERH